MLLINGLVSRLCSSSSQEDVVESPDVHFEPLVKLQPIETKTMEENEDEIFKMCVSGSPPLSK